jgi:hypothetical protein
MSMEPVRKAALRLKMFKVIDNPIRLCMYAQKVLKKTGTETSLVNGWALCAGQSCWSVWLEDHLGNKYDIAGTLAKLKEPDVGDFMLTIEEPNESFKRVDDGAMEVEFETFEKDPKKYWKDASKQLKNLKI